MYLSCYVLELSTFIPDGLVSIISQGMRVDGVRALFIIIQLLEMIAEPVVTVANMSPIEHLLTLEMVTCDDSQGLKSEYFFFIALYKYNNNKKY